MAFEPGAVGVTVTSPNGGEAWAGGQVHAITWTTVGGPLISNPITLAVSWDGGASWSQIAAGQPNIGTFAWTVPLQNEPDTLIRVTAVDTAGNATSDTSNAVFVVDSLIQVPGGLAASPAQTWTNSNDFSLTWTNPPDLSGIVGAYYKLDAEPQSANDGTFVATTQPRIPHISVPGDGQHSIYLWLVDRAGNVNAGQRNALFNVFWFDGRAPVSSVELSGTPGTNGWYRSPVDVSLSALDPEPGSGVAALFHRLDDQAVQTTTSFRVEAAGVHQLSHSALDVAGNREMTRTVMIQIDTMPPSASVSLDQMPSAGGWYTQPVRATFVVTDDLSGVAGVRYRLDNGAWMTGTTTLIDADGDHLLEYQAVDLAGNEQGLQSIPVPYDHTPPTTAYQPDPNSVLGDNGWYRSVITVTLVPTDAGSGVAQTRYRIDTGTWQNGTQFVLSEEGEHVVEFYSIDNAGNVEIPYPITLRIDTQAPSAPPPPLPSPTTWSNQNSFSFIWSKPNDRSGIAGAYYKLGSPPTGNLDGTFVSVQVVEGIHVPAEGRFDLYVWLRDGAGNVDYTRNSRIPNAFRYDATMPLTSVGLQGLAGENGWYVGPVTATLVVTDSLSGVAATTFRIDTGAWQTGTTALIGGDDKHTLTYYSTDLAGNAETARVQTIRIDTHAPGAPQNVSLSPSGWSHVNEFALAWTSPLDLSGVAGIYYKFDLPPNGPRDGTFLAGVNFVSGVHVPREGQHTLYAWLRDVAGNVDASQRVVLANAARFDATSPTTSVQAVGTPGSNGWYVSPVAVTLTPSDAGSGVARTEIRVDGSPWFTGTGVVIGTDGVHQLEFRSTDVAGNVEAVQSRTYQVDLTPPVTRLVDLAPYQVNRTFTLRWQGTDRPGSGLVGYDVQVREGTTGAWTDFATNWQSVSRVFTGQYGKTYYVRVRARDLAGNVGTYTTGNGDSMTYVTGINNYSFETASFAGWRAGGALAYSIAPPPSPPPPGVGAYSAELGSEAYGQSPPSHQTVPIGSAAITQTVAIPPKTEWPATYLSVWYRIYTYDVVYSVRRQAFYDSFDVDIYSTSGISLSHLLRDGNYDVSLTGDGRPVVDLGWRQAVFDLSGFAGQTIQVQLANFNRNDRVYNTWTYVDNVVLYTPFRRAAYMPLFKR